MFFDWLGPTLAKGFQVLGFGTPQEKHSILNVEAQNQTLHFPQKKMWCLLSLVTGRNFDLQSEDIPFSRLILLMLYIFHSFEKLKEKMCDNLQDARNAKLPSVRDPLSIPN